MQLFLKKILKYFSIAFLCLIVVLVATSILARPKASKRGRGVVLNKLALLQNSKSPKIILIGGSNICYGINSKLIVDSFNLPVIDMSINAGMGMVFYMNQIKPYIKEGDIIISIPEYSSYSNSVINGDDGLYSLCSIAPDNYKALTTYQWFASTKYFGEIILNNYKTFFANNNAEVSNGRFLYDSLGNYFGHKGKDVSINIEVAKKNCENTLKNCNDYFLAVKNFESFCKKNKATYLHSFPVFARELYNPKWNNIINNELSSITIINQADRYLFGVDSLYDSENHLQFQYRDIRTERMISDLRQYFVSQHSTSVQKK